MGPNWKLLSVTSLMLPAMSVSFALWDLAGP
jgi:hypothetical protein